MARNRLLPSQKARIQALFDAGWSSNKISEDMKLSQATVMYWKTRPFLDLVGTTAKRGQSGRNPAITARRALAKEVALRVVTKGGKKRPAHCSARSVGATLVSEAGIKVSRWTIRRDLVASGLVATVRKRVPTVFAGDMARRLAFCKNLLGFTGDRFVFSDEKIFTVADYTRRSQWVPENNRDLALPRERTRYCDRIMVWGAIGHNYFVWYVIPNQMTASGKPNARRHGILDAELYMKAVLPLVVPHLRKNKLLFQQDGASTHTCKVVRAFFDRSRVSVLPEWPPRSPDLNPIETLWSILQGLVADEFPTTMEELEVAIDKVFRNFRETRMDTINNLVNSFTKRCQRVVDRGGSF